MNRVPLVMFLLLVGCASPGPSDTSLPPWDLVMPFPFGRQDPMLRGLSRVVVTENPPHDIWYSSQTGMKVYEIVEFASGETRSTTWAPDGRIDTQSWEMIGSQRNKTSPPWLWGATDQTEPTAPWWKGGK